MRFNDIAAALESRENCSLLIKREAGNLFVDNLHKYISTDKQIIRSLDFNTERVRAEMIKENLAYILNNWSSIEVHALGWRPTKRKGR